MMSSTAAQPGPKAPATGAPAISLVPSEEPEPPPVEALGGLRAQIDGVDDALHDLLMRRAAIVAQVAQLRGKVAFRPGREAAIVRRLLARHTGPLPARAIARLWREMFMAHIAIETKMMVSVCEPAAAAGFVAAAHEHFGALTALRIHRTPAQALADVANRLAMAAVLPLPVEEEPAHAAWWTSLLHRDAPRLHVVGRLPFWASPRPEGATAPQALVVAAAAPDASGQDRSLLGLEVPPDMSRARLAAALAAAGVVPGGILLRRAAPAAAYGLVDLDGAMAEDDSRMPALAAAGLRPVVLGGYALPIEWSGS